ncbi:hypothetical protein VNO77_18836 [Canavalia gladiata]|uniref:Uncharacterized protein n=1 Tax=Canavalia gladiata TaxID=3824 RepID=A0AAN9LQ89_CANGL
MAGKGKKQEGGRKEGLIQVQNKGEHTLFQDERPEPDHLIPQCSAPFDATSIGRQEGLPATENPANSTSPPSDFFRRRLNRILHFQLVLQRVKLLGSPLSLSRSRSWSSARRLPLQASRLAFEAQTLHSNLFVVPFSTPSIHPYRQPVGCESQNEGGSSGERLGPATPASLLTQLRSLTGTSPDHNLPYLYGYNNFKPRMFTVSNFVKVPRLWATCAASEM